MRVGQGMIVFLLWVPLAAAAGAQTVTRPVLTATPPTQPAATASGTPAAPAAMPSGMGVPAPLDGVGQSGVGQSGVGQDDAGKQGITNPAPKGAAESGNAGGAGPGTIPGTTPGTTPGTNPGTTPGTNPGSAAVKAGDAAAVAATSNAAWSHYVIGPEDTIQVNVWREPGFSGSFPVRTDGMISLALVGDLPAAGFTPMKLSEDIAGRLKKYVNEPSVTVSVLSFKQKQIYLLGEVLHVGPLAISPDMTPLQAISAAGGISPYAKATKIYILRGEPGKQKKILFNYKKALKTGDEQGVTLSPGDTIVVP